MAGFCLKNKQTSTRVEVTLHLSNRNNGSHFGVFTNAKDFVRRNWAQSIFHLLIVTSHQVYPVKDDTLIKIIPRVCCFTLSPVGIPLSATPPRPLVSHLFHSQLINFVFCCRKYSICAAPRRSSLESITHIQAVRTDATQISNITMKECGARRHKGTGTVWRAQHTINRHYHVHVPS